MQIAHTNDGEIVRNPTTQVHSIRPGTLERMPTHGIRTDSLHRRTSVIKEHLALLPSPYCVFDQSGRITPSRGQRKPAVPLRAYPTEALRAERTTPAPTKRRWGPPLLRRPPSRLPAAHLTASWCCTPSARSPGCCLRAEESPTRPPTRRSSWRQVAPAG